MIECATMQSALLQYMSPKYYCSILMDAMYDVRMRIAIPCMVPRGYLRGPPLKRSRFLGVVLSGESR